MNVDPLSALSDAFSLSRGSPCNSPRRNEAADSLLSLLRTSPGMPPSYGVGLTSTSPPTPRSTSKRSAPRTMGVSLPKSSTEEECLILQRHPVKRQKRAKKDHHVTFAIMADDLISCPPYVPGLSDAECLQLFRGDIWYTDKDYAEFWKDRINTIRVYRSVHGNMTGLSQHYSVRGLEHYLQFEQHLLLQRQQLALVAAVLSEQKRQVTLKGTMKAHYKPGQATSEDSGPEAIRSIVARLTVTAQEEAVARAALDVASSDDDRQDESCSSSDGDDEDDDSVDEELETDTKSKSWDSIVAPSATASTWSSIATLPPSGRRTFSVSSLTSTTRVNMAALRELNLRMLQELQQKPLDIICSMSSAVSTSDEETNVSASVLHSAGDEVDQWSRILHLEHHRRCAISSTTQQGLDAGSTEVGPFLPNSNARIFRTSVIRRDSLALARQHLQQQQQHQQHQNYDKRRTSQEVSEMRMPSYNLQRRTQFPNAHWSHHGPLSEVSLPSNVTTTVSICRSDSLSGLR